MKRPFLMVCLCMILLWAAGIGLGGIPREESLPRVLSDKAEVTIRAKVRYKDGSKIFLSSVEIISQAADSQQIFPINSEIIVKYEELQDERIPRIGQILIIRGEFRKFSHATNPGEADMAAYYASIKVCGSMKRVRILQSGRNYRAFFEKLYEWREVCRERIFQVFPQKEASVMAALLIGDKTELDSGIYEAYKRNGILHILSISGLHISVIGFGINKLLRKINIPCWAAAAAGAVVLTVYGCFVGMGITVYRAVGMYLLKQFSILFGRTYDMPTAAGFLAVLILWRNPLYLTNAGFLLSFGAVCGVGGIYRVFFAEWLDSAERKRNQSQIRENKTFCLYCQKLLQKAKDCLIQSMLVSVSVTVATLPIQLYFYYEVPVFGFIVNLLVAPFLGILIVTGLIVMGIPGTGVLGSIDCMILRYYEKICRLTDRLPFGFWNPGCPKIKRIFLYYGVLAAGLIWIYMIRKKENQELKPKPKSDSKFKILSAAVLTVAVIFLAYPAGHGTEIYFLDVGQGDGIVLRTPGNEVYLFDFGSSSRNEPGKYLLKPFFKYIGIKKIKAVTVSHKDADHTNGIEELLKNRDDWRIAVEHIFLPAGREADFIKWEELLGDSVNIRWIKAGMSWDDDGVRFVCLHPDTDEGSLSANASSACYLVSCDGVTILFTGDVEKEGEEKLLANIEKWNAVSGSAVRVDILKVPHHGSRYSTTGELIEMIRPVCAVISCGRNNRYGHPHEELLDRLSGAETNIFRTDAEGAVLIRIESGKYAVETFMKGRKQ